MAESLGQTLRCAVCSHIYSEPVTLDCGHNFCRACVLGRWEGEEGTVTCPQCCQRFPRRELKTNQLLATLVTSLGLLNLGPSPGVGTERCPSHRELPMLFCPKDLTLVCPGCLAQGSEGRNSLIPTEEAFALCQEMLESSATFLEKRLEEYREAEVSQASRTTQTAELAESLRESIEGQFGAMHQFLREQERGLRERLGQESQGLVQTLEANLMLLAKRSNSIEKLIAEIRSLVNAKDRARLLTEVKDVLQRSDLHREPVLPPPEVSLGELRGPLQYAAWKRMLEVISPAPALLTLDPDSASPCLILSKDHTMVKRRAKLRQMPASSRRFTVCAAVLAAQGFSAGRHYWEVDVEASPAWIVGAAGESAERGEDVPLTPDNGFWTVRLWNGKVHWCGDGTGTGGSASCSDLRPDRVGIFLDYEGGQLSFYDARCMSHLCTFYHRFREPLYPFLFPLSGPDTSDTEVLRLFHLRL